MNKSQDIKMQMVDVNVGIRVRYNAVQNDGDEYGNGNVETTPAKGNGNGINDNPIRAKVNCTSEDILQQASTSRTQFENAPFYDLDTSVEVSEPKGTTKGTRTNTLFTKHSILGEPPSSSSYKPKFYSVTLFPKSLVLLKVNKTNALSKPVTSNSASSTRESKVVQTVNVISPRIFRTNHSNTSRVYNVVPNKLVKISVRIKPITVSQPNVIHKQQANSDSNGFSSTRVNNTAKTRRPHPRSNSNTDSVPSKSKSSCLSNTSIK
nr:hypothetical protein [Tanacetum cinerariifolium]GEV69269.1 hypothetical protein [Tanacetum cinerariifolium]